MTKSLFFETYKRDGYLFKCYFCNENKQYLLQVGNGEEVGAPVCFICKKCFCSLKDKNDDQM